MLTYWSSSLVRKNFNSDSGAEQGVFEHAKVKALPQKDEPEGATKPGLQTMLIAVVLVVSVVLAGWVLVTISTAGHIPSSDFVTLPTTILSTQGEKTMFVSVSALQEARVAVGVRGYLQTASGAPVAGVTVYVTYYLQGAYRTQAASTKQDGFFEARFPMNWTGWLPVTLTYFGNGQHQGIRQVFSVSGENL